MSKPDEKVLSDRDDIEMMKRPHLWTWPALPLKRPAKDRPGIETALLYESDENDPKVPVVIGSNLFGNLGDVEIKLYLDAEAVYDDGWRVD